MLCEILKYVKYRSTIGQNYLDLETYISCLINPLISQNAQSIEMKRYLGRFMYNEYFLKSLVLKLMDLTICVNEAFERSGMINSCLAEWQHFVLSKGCNLKLK